ncbi:MAG TPA: tRNA (N6-isopentenyl adenosine(37)-C2)-methylthiotransferase MiaB [Bacillota bacterium]|nr:tRNA (N6-isopentenyl adenosine(37)-C2)-methylthiotransferase MiaB [Bacillota bacterium]
MAREIQEMELPLQPESGDKSYLTITFGCQANEFDTEVLAGMLESLGYRPAASPEEADIIVVNTCAVRRKPEEKVAALLGRLKSLKEKKESLIIAVGGCMIQQPDVAAELARRFRHVNLFFGTHALPRFPQLLQQAQVSRRPLIDIEENGDCREGLPMRRSSSFRAWVPVIYGCNNFCSYCIVPYVRGRERSRPFDEIVREVRSLAEKGYLEVTLLGQNVNSYGHDLDEGRDFADLLEALDRIDGLSRIRFLTSHPKDLSPRLIKAMRSGSKICEHLHLPAQAGSNRILQLMNRRYTRERYLELVERLREAIPGIALTTDLMVGFPGETEEDFQQTLALVEEARFDQAFTFIYSPRRGTRAAEMKKEEIPADEKRERLRRLARLQNEISLQINRTLVGKRVELLVEGKSKNNPAMQSGRTRTNKLVHFAAEEDLTGKLVEVEITAAYTWYLAGKLLEPAKAPA